MSGAVDISARRWWPAAVVVLLACLPYVETPWFGFVAHDDPGHVTKNPWVSRGLTLRGAAWAFGVGAEPAVDGWLNWPLTWLSHMADVSLFGAWAGGHHVVNVLLHAVNAVLVLALVRRLGLGDAAALIGAAVFAVHPTQVESVAWVSERKTVLCSCLLFLSMLAYLRWREARVSAGGDSGDRAAVWLLAWNVLGVLALLAKPLAVTLPCVLLLLDAVPLGRLESTTPRGFVMTLARCVPEKIPLFLAVVGTCAWTVASQSHAGAVTHLPLVTRLAHATVAYDTYLRVFFWPSGLAVIHQHQGMPTPAAFVAAVVVILTVTALTVVAARRGRPLPLVGWLWFIGTLVPMIGIVQVGSNGWSERYLYVPIVGLAVAVAAAGEWLVARVSMTAAQGVGPVSRRLAAGVAAFWIAVLAGLAWWQTGQWRDTATLAARTLAANPARPAQQVRPGDATARWYAFTWLAADALERRDHAAAERWLLEAERIPEFPQKQAALQASLGRLMLDTGRDVEAARRFTAALAHAPRDVPSRVGLGLALLRGGDARQAEEIFRRLTEERPRIPLPWVGLASAALQLGRTAEATACCERALALAPGDRAALAVLQSARVAIAGTAERGP